MKLSDLELESLNVKLVPMEAKHANDLVCAASDGELWNLWYTSVPDKESINHYIAHALLEKEKGIALPFVVLDKVSENIIGTTRLCNVDLINRRLEIGYTWYSKSYQKTCVNTECKTLLLKHAFEQLEVIAVEFRTSWHNHASRAAITRLGAKQDGILRNHQNLGSGVYRDTVVFSIINIEWPAVKVHLGHKLSRRH